MHSNNYCIFGTVTLVDQSETVRLAILLNFRIIAILYTTRELLLFIGSNVSLANICAFFCFPT